MKNLLALPLALAALVATSSAQPIHTVDLASTPTNNSFSPQHLTICEGDTVQWVWVSGFHDVTSGTGGVPDGAFSSGSPVFPPNTFSVTFDAAFLTTNPMPGGVYDYFCSVHVALGMTGTVSVRSAATSIENGAGVNPLTLSNQNLPRIGLPFTVDLDCSAHAAHFGAWFGASGPVGSGVMLSLGEYLLPPGPLVFVVSGAHGGGAISFTQVLPNNIALCGRVVTTQGLCLGAPGAQLSNALQATAGP